MTVSTHREHQEERPCAHSSVEYPLASMVFAGSAISSWTPSKLILTPRQLRLLPYSGIEADYVTVADA